MNGDEITKKIYPTVPSSAFSASSSGIKESRVTSSAPPILPTPPMRSTPEFKYGKLLEVRQDLVNEVEKYGKTIKRYKKGKKACFGTSTTFASVSGLTAVGTAVSGVTGIGLIIAIPLASVSAFSGFGGFITNFISNHLNKKLIKHSSVLTLAKETLFTLDKMVVRLKDDGEITKEEFVLAYDLIEEYYKQKKILQKKYTSEKDLLEMSPIIKKEIEKIAVDIYNVKKDIEEKNKTTDKS